MALDQNALDRKIGDNNTTPKRLQNKSQYDLKRETLEADSVREGAEAKKQAGATATQRGFGVGSGFQEALKRKIGVENKRNLGARLGAVDIQELGAQETRDEAERGRTFTTSERLGREGFASGEAEKGRGFATSEREAGQDFASEEAGKGRDFTSEEAEKGRTFASEEAGKGRTFATSEREAGEKFKTDLTNINQTNQVALTNLNDQLLSGRMTLQETLNTQRETRAAKSTAAYNAGVAGQEADPNWSEAELASYNAGTSGKSKEEADRNYKRRQEFENTAIMALDPEDKYFQNDLNNMLIEFGYDTGKKKTATQRTTQGGKVIEGIGY